MANNRLYLTCKVCDQSILIGKHFAGALSTSVLTLEALDQFYFDHFYCTPDVHYSLALTEEFEGEMVYNAVKIDHMRELYGTDCPCVTCSECGEESPYDAKHCMGCGALFVGDTVKGTPDI